MRFILNNAIIRTYAPEERVIVMTSSLSSFHNRMCGKLLGDGSIVKQARRKPRFKFQHRTEDFGWTNYCYHKLKNNIPLAKPIYKKNIEPRLRKEYSEFFYVQSKTDPVITELYETWYPNGNKSLPFHYLEQHLDEQALSWWYQDDGHLKIVNGKMQKIILSTDSFTTNENYILQNLLWNKWKLSFKLDKQNRLILYDQFQIIYFLHLIQPWLQPFMARKSAVILPLRPIANRTTIYLPETIQLQSPTKDIHIALRYLNFLYQEKQTKVICHERLFQTLRPITEVTTSTSSYQISIQEPYKSELAYLRQRTGLTVSELIIWCFNKKSPTER